MREMFFVTGFMLFFSLSPANCQESLKKEQIQKWSKYYGRLAAEYDLKVPTESGTEKLELLPVPVLRWHNPIRATTHGECFVWTRDGRVEAVASLFSYPNDDGRRVAHAFNCLTEQSLTASRNGQDFWTVPTEDVTKMIPLPGDVPVAAKAPLRLSQMRTIIRGFSANSDGTQSEDGRELRLLTTPLYRYSQSADSQRDGALFAFTMGTDPEVLLLLESRGEQGSKSWYFLPMRHSHTSLSVKYKQEKVWSHQRGNQTPTYLSQHGIDRQPAMLP